MPSHHEFGAPFPVPSLDGSVPGFLHGRKFRSHPTMLPGRLSGQGAGAGRDEGRRRAGKRDGGGPVRETEAGRDKSDGGGPGQGAGAGWDEGRRHGGGPGQGGRRLAGNENVTASS